MLMGIGLVKTLCSASDNHQATVRFLSINAASDHHGRSVMRFDHMENQIIRVANFRSPWLDVGDATGCHLLRSKSSKNVT
ncbi:hypothetical protein ATO67_07635 [Agrobacterium bohemicum]|uniref:Uncharacterized protein n=1 Tax=Agrobacterium bohemicum TaxID=2052828 RepID=A0A135P1X8_9HYPH|nr:hypothetical protein ATO67_07635 [Agrobacterium bohemicum]